MEEKKPQKRERGGTKRSMSRKRDNTTEITNENNDIEMEDNNDNKRPSLRRNKTDVNAKPKRSFKRKPVSGVENNDETVKTNRNSNSVKTGNRNSNRNRNSNKNNNNDNIINTNTTNNNRNHRASSLNRNTNKTINTLKKGLNRTQTETNVTKPNEQNIYISRSKRPTNPATGISIPLPKSNSSSREPSSSTACAALFCRVCARKSRRTQISMSLPKSVFSKGRSYFFAVYMNFCFLRVEGQKEKFNKENPKFGVYFYRNVKCRVCHEEIGMFITRANKGMIEYLDHFILNDQVVEVRDMPPLSKEELNKLSQNSKLYSNCYDLKTAFNIIDPKFSKFKSEYILMEQRYNKTYSEYEKEVITFKNVKNRLIYNLHNSENAKIYEINKRDSIINKINNNIDKTLNEMDVDEINARNEDDNYTNNNININNNINNNKDNDYDNNDDDNDIDTDNINDNNNNNKNVTDNDNDTEIDNNINTIIEHKRKFDRSKKVSRKSFKRKYNV